MPGWPKRFIAIRISIAAMAMSTFNTVRITQLNDEINTLKEKTDLILDVVHLHEKHLHHLEEKLDQTSKHLADLLESNIWFSSKVTDAIEKKFQSVIHHHEMWLNPPNTTDSLQGPCHMTFWMESLTTSPRWPRGRTWSHLSNLLLTFFKLRYRTSTHWPRRNSAWFSTSLWSQITIFWTSTSSCHYQFTSTSPQTSPSRRMLAHKSAHNWTLKIFSNNFQCWLTHLSPPGGHFLLQRKESHETSLKRSCLGALYMANSQSIQNHCRFKIAEDREKIFKLSENTWAVYSVGMISTNEVCPAANDITAMRPFRNWLCLSWKRASVLPNNLYFLATRSFSNIDEFISIEFQTLHLPM